MSDCVRSAAPSSSGWHFVVSAFNHTEKHAAVRHESGCLAELLAERRVVQKEEVLQEHQPRSLVVRITRHDLTEFVEGVGIQLLRVSDEFS